MCTWLQVSSRSYASASVGEIMGFDWSNKCIVLCTNPMQQFFIRLCKVVCHIYSAATVSTWRYMMVKVKQHDQLFYVDFKYSCSYESMGVWVPHSHSSTRHELVLESKTLQLRHHQPILRPRTFHSFTRHNAYFNARSTSRTNARRSTHTIPTTATPSSGTPAGGLGVLVTLVLQYTRHMAMVVAHHTAEVLCRLCILRCTLHPQHTRKTQHLPHTQRILHPTTITTTLLACGLLLVAQARLQLLSHFTAL